MSAVSDIGNIYSDEILFEAGLYPEEKCVDLNVDDWNNLAVKIKEVIVWGIKANEMTAKAYLVGAGKKYRNMPDLRVYGREGQPCRRCGAVIERIVIMGIGAETADVISVYAFHKPSFVIDAYTRRFLERLGFRFNSDDEIRSFFERGLKRDYQLYGWYHWLILEHGIKHCRKAPFCKKCVFDNLCGKC